MRAAIYSAMSWETWEAIAKRHARYRDLLIERMAEWPDSKIDACTDLGTLKYVVQLAERVERHDERMNRHVERGLARLKAPSANVN